MLHAMTVRWKTIYLFACLVVGGFPTQQAIKLSEIATRAQEALEGLFYYYWENDPYSKDVKFFFACGQIGGYGVPGDGTQCECYTPTSCVNCYRWWDAVALESIANFGIYSNTKQYANISDTIFSHSPYNANWNAAVSCTFIDDFSWYGIAYLRVYDWLKDDKWLDRSVAIYNWTWNYGWDGECGGFWWSNCNNQHFKDSITIMEILHLGSKLAYTFPKDDFYLERAQKIWNWVFSFDGGRGIMSNQYLVSTGVVPETCCNGTIENPLRKCFNSNVSGTSYNQGLLLSSAAYLYKRTHNHTYLDVGKRALEAVFENYTTKEGILVDEPRSYQTYQDKCIGWEDPGGDWYSFQGIFMNHLGYFTTLLSDGVSLSNDTLTKIKNLVEKTSDAAWTRSAVRPPFKNGYDVCNTGPLKPNTTLPKFHWWWGKNNTQQIVPPDLHLFYHKVQLRCSGRNITYGLVKDEDKCRKVCARNVHCSKYLFQTDQSVIQGVNCWQWSYNRSDHSCQQKAPKFNVGIKRALGTASCAGHCGSGEPLKMKYGVCYCDEDCINHLDCCRDYADHCSVAKPIPSCENWCNKQIPHAIPGGGYCWCTDGCNPYYTDNNSDGSCCPDYNQQCIHHNIPQCLDARSQGSALNLFLTHLRLEQNNKSKN